MNNSFKATIGKIKILDGKKDKNGKYFRPVVIESAELQFPYWRNVYDKDEETLKWLEGDEVEIEITDSPDGKWHNFIPVSALKQMYAKKPAYKAQPKTLTLEERVLRLEKSVFPENLI